MSTRFKASTRTAVHACEAADALHLARQLSVIAQLLPEAGVLAMPLAGGIAATTLASFGRKLNHVAGAGMTEALTLEHLDQLRTQYAKCGVPIEIDLCPHSPPANLELLGAAGFWVNAYTNEYCMDLSERREEASMPSSLQLRPIDADEHARFIQASIAAFSAQPKPRPHALLELLARVATLRADSVLYVAEIQGEVVATAALAMLQTELGLCAHLHVTGTLPNFRGRGAQAALVDRRLRDAQQRGAQLASLTARPGTSSARNAERCGFSLAYTKPTFRQPNV